METSKNQPYKTHNFFTVEKINLNPLTPVQKMESKIGVLKPIDGEQLFINIISLNRFHFVRKPLFQD